MNIEIIPPDILDFYFMAALQGFIAEEGVSSSEKGISNDVKIAWAYAQESMRQRPERINPLSTLSTHGNNDLGD